jgi:hypothetical protein
MYVQWPLIHVRKRLVTLSPAGASLVGHLLHLLASCAPQPQQVIVSRCDPAVPEAYPPHLQATHAFWHSTQQAFNCQHTVWVTYSLTTTEA